jgi:hypothetical protein
MDTRLKKQKTKTKKAKADEAKLASHAFDTRAENLKQAHRPCA